MSSVVKVALPILGGVVGGFFGGPAGYYAGSAVGGYLGGRSYGGGEKGGLMGAAGSVAGAYVGSAAGNYLSGMGSGGSAADGFSSTSFGDNSLGAYADGGASAGLSGAGDSGALAAAGGGAYPGMSGAGDFLTAGGVGSSGSVLSGLGGAADGGISGSGSGLSMGNGTGQVMGGTTPSDSNMSILDKLKQFQAGKGVGKAEFNIGTGVLGMIRAEQMRKAADPFAQYREQYGQKLQALEANPGSITTMPGYQAGLQAVQRSGAAQGFTGSGNMAAALAGYGQNFFQQQQQMLAGFAGGGAPVGQGAGASYIAENNALRGIGNGLGAFVGP